MRALLYIFLFTALYMIFHNFLFVYLVKLLSLFIKRDSVPSEAIQKISVILPVFNEEGQIVNKLSNTLVSLEKVNIPYEVLIGSDGSQDKTREIVREYIGDKHLENFRLLEFKNEGKGQTINKLVGEASGDLIVSTDADTEIEVSAIQRIIDEFQKDKQLGCLSCVPVFRSKKMGIQSTYWSYELKVRDAESNIGALIVVTGWLYAYRRELFKSIPEKAMADDLWIPLSILLQGKKSKHLKDLKCFSEETDESTEVARRKRVISGGADIVKRLFLTLLEKPTLFFIVFSHKINRWLVPFWVIILLATSMLINPVFIFLYFMLAIVFMLILGPKKMLYLICSIVAPIFSLDKLSGKVDLSKWKATRINKM